MKPIKVNLNVSNISSKVTSKNLPYPPDYIDLVNNLNLLRVNGRLDECKKLCNEAILKYPKYIHPLNILAVVLMESDYKLASKYFKKIIKMSFSDNSSQELQLNSYRNLATCYQNMGDYKKAINYYVLFFDKLENFNENLSNAKPLKLDNEYIRTSIALVDCYILLDNFNEANKILFLLEKEKKSSLSYLVLVRIGMIYFKNGDLDKSFDYYKKSLMLNNEYFYTHSCLGDFYLAKNDIENAEYHFYKSIEYNSKNYNSLKKLEKMNKVNLENDLIKDLELKITDLKKKNNDERTIVDNQVIEEGGQIFFSLYEKNGSYDKAFEYLKLSNEIHLLNKNYSFAEQKKNFNKVISLFDKHFFEKNLPVTYLDYRPIFIIGMPRSGTTLIEQILSSHSNVAACGEVNFLDAMINNLLNNKKLSKGSIKFFENLSLDNKLSYVETYLSSIENFSNSSKMQKITDKSLINFIHVGLIYLLFPGAKIINLIRNPMDVCFSIYKTNFDSNYYNWSYKFETIIEYFQYYKKIINHWDALFPGRIYHMSYEKLIKDPNNEIKGLLSYCDLSYEKSCIDFYKNKRTVLTASSLQVRNKINNNSIERWKNYEKYLGIFSDKLN